MTKFLFYSLLLGGASAVPQGPGGHHDHNGPGHQGPGGGPRGSSGGQISPSYDWIFQYPLPIPPIAQPKYTEEVDGKTIRYYEMTIEAYDHEVYPGLGPAHLSAYSMTTDFYTWYNC